MRLAGKKAVVTGASRGMGRHLAEALAAEGAAVALLARPSDALTAAAAAIEGACAVGCDIGNRAEVAAAIEQAGRTLGGIDILVNNAVFATINRIEDLAYAEVEAQIAVNLAGPIYTCRAAIAWLRKSAGADIVNISSEGVKLPMPYLSVYGATKAALEHFTAALRAELRPDLIRVSVLRSGAVAGGSIGRDWDEAKFARFLDALVKSGHAEMNGANPAPAELMAEGLIGLLTLPRAVNVDLIELRPTAP